MTFLSSPISFGHLKLFSVKFYTITHPFSYYPNINPFADVLFHFSVPSLIFKNVKCLNKHFPYSILPNKTWCFYPYLETALHLRIFLGTLASCSVSGDDKSSFPCHRIFPVSASRRFIQLTLKPLRISSAFEGMIYLWFDFVPTIGFDNVILQKLISRFFFLSTRLSLAESLTH